MRIIDSVPAPGRRLDNWSFGGGTVLMRRLHHRMRKTYAELDTLDFHPSFDACLKTVADILDRG